MVYFVYTMRAIEGQAEALQKLAKTMTKAAQKYVPEDLVSFEKVSNITGDRTQIHLVSKARSLSAWESAFEKTQKDKAFAAAMKKYTEEVKTPGWVASGQFYRVDEVD